MDLYPEAKLNLIIFYLRENKLENAYQLVQTIEPISTKDYILRAVVYTLYGQKKSNQDMIQKAVKQFQLIGTSSNECDTIPGRQCIASFLFLKKQFEEVVVYLKTI